MTRARFTRPEANGAEHASMGGGLANWDSDGILG